MNSDVKEMPATHVKRNKSPLTSAGGSRGYRFAPPALGQGPTCQLGSTPP